MKSNMMFPQKTKTRTTVSSSNITPGHISKGMCCMTPQSHLHTHSYLSTVYNSKALGAAQVPHD
jgi:hypothetical protein